MKKLSSKVLKKARWFSEPNLNISKTDFDSPKRRIYLNKSSKIKPGTSGTFRSKKCNREIFYESQIEKRFFATLEVSNEVVDYGCQPLNIKYIHKGSYHKYYPDFYYLLSSGECIIGEIKPAIKMGIIQTGLNGEQ